MRRAKYVLILFCLLLLTPLVVAEESSFDSNGVEIHYRVMGDGEPVLLLHGISGSGDNWHQFGIAPALAKDYRVITMDLRGHGQSGKPHDARKYGHEIAEDVVRLLDHLQIKKAHIVGFSLGGFVTIKLLTTRPECITSAIVVGWGWIDPVAGNKRWIPAADLLDQGKGPAMAFLRSSNPDAPPPNQAQLDALNRGFLEGNDPKALGAALRNISQLCVTETQLRAIRVPVLSIVGENDHLKPDVDRMGGLLPDHRIEVIPNAGHVEAGLRPEFIELVRTFLAKQSEAAYADD
jgi:pimeloyl-ACP methyl ester carboxylesterase